MMGCENNRQKRISNVYNQIYEFLCGRHPELRVWHFQWLAGHYLYRQFRELLPSLGGRVLDVGCGGKPYRSWFGVVSEYVGLDVTPGASVDVVVSSNERWPFPDEHFDVLFSSQVFEHAEYLEFTLLEMKRVLNKGGCAVLTFPFLYNEHGAPWDFRRFTIHGAAQLSKDYEIVRLEKLGGIGSTLSLLLLNWLSNYKFIKALMPIWIPFSLIVNFMGLLLDRLDRTGAFYNNVILVMRKPQQ